MGMTLKELWEKTPEEIRNYDLAVMVRSEDGHDWTWATSVVESGTDGEGTIYLTTKDRIVYTYSFKIVVAGGRDFKDYDLLKEKLDYFFKNINQDSVIISGGSRGFDKLVEKYALEKGYKIQRFPADWKSLGKKAGMIRNMEMAKNCDMGVCFWDGKSVGPANMISCLEKLDKSVRVVKY